MYSPIPKGQYECTIPAAVSGYNGLYPAHSRPCYVLSCMNADEIESTLKDPGEGAARGRAKGVSVRFVASGTAPMRFGSTRRSWLQRAKGDLPWFLMIAAPALYYFIFHYLPMYGLIISFFDYNIPRGILGSKWVGLEWFRQFFSSIYFFRLIRNTLLISFFSLIFEFPVPILFAVCLDEVKLMPFKRFAQTASYLPHFVSTVVVVGIMVNFLSPNTGLVNAVLNNLGIASVDFMESSRWFRPLYIGSNIWQNFGFSSIVYLAAISGINPELYDAASVDGCSRLQRVLHVTLPGIAPTIIILFILRIGSVLSVGFEKIILMYSGSTYDVADVISTYVYRRGIISGEFSFATAVGLFNSMVNMLFLVTFNYLARRFSESSLW